jgi:chromosome segregation protein
MGVPVRKLSLQGYKSFARRTEFIFERGITAIVGPNGSGKSNVSDALRWVLGEQAYSSLRSKRTEDMIFSGSDGHRRLGMAQVSLTFDNDEGWLPIDFSEVTISRRAHRSGGNEYLINGARVRLRDIAELLAGAGLSQRTYTVIGQGLVDRALALQSRDRRPLFEEAAGIVGYQMRRDEALGKLDETRDNLVRVSDIIAEITPRLSRLARQAEEAERHARLSDRLDEALRLSYGYRWHTGQERLGEAQALAEHQAALLSEAQSQLRSIQHETAQHEREVQRLEGRGSAIRRERRALERRLAELNRERAVREERERLLLQRQGESTEERSALQDQEATQRHRIAEVESALTELEAGCQEEQAEIERLRAERAGLEQQRSHLRAQTRSLGQRARELFQSQAERQAEWTQVRSRRAALQESRLARQEAVRREQETADALREEQHALAERREELENQVAALEDRRHQVAEQQETLRLSTGELQSIGEELERDVARVTARRDLLSRLRQQAYHPGVQAVVSTAKSGRLARVRGLVGGGHPGRTRRSPAGCASRGLGSSPACPNVPDRVTTRSGYASPIERAPSASRS